MRKWTPKKPYDPDRYETRPYWQDGRSTMLYQGMVPIGIIEPTADAITAADTERWAHVLVGAPEVIADLLTEAEWGLGRIEGAHYKCDLDNPGECYAEQYGDGSASDHAGIREGRERIAAARKLIGREG